MFISGFADIRYREWFKNLEPNHEVNAIRIIESKGWLDEYRNDPIHSITACDFLIFRKGFAQIGSSGQENIMVSAELYKYDINHSKIWKALWKALDKEELNVLYKYKILYMLPPRS